MKVAGLLPALTLLAGTLGAQTPPSKPGSVEGVVSNSATGEPVSRVVVTLRKLNNQDIGTAVSDASGHFHFNNVAPGSYFVTADREGFQSEQSGYPSALAKRFEVAEEQHIQDVAIKFVPLGTVSGHVLDEDGDPIPRAQISVERYYYNQRRKQLNQTASAQSNDLGEFEVLNIPPGHYYVRVMAPPLQNIPPHTRWTHPEKAYPVTFYPNAREVGQATAANITPGAQLNNIDFRLRKMPAYHVRGTVAGKPGTNDVVTAESLDANFGNAAESNVKADGSFDLRGMVSGSYRVFYLRLGLEEAFTANQTVQVSDADVNGVAMVRKPAVEVFGTVTVEGSPPDKLDLQVSLTTIQNLNQGGNGRAGADGKLVIAASPPEVYNLQFGNVPPGKYVKSIRFGDRDIKNGEIDLTTGSSAPLSIVLGADGGEVDGTVQTANGQAAGGTKVILAPTEEFQDRWDLLKLTVSDRSGNFQIKDIAPGEYRVFAWESDPDGSTRSTEFRKLFENRSVPVIVEPSAMTSVQVNVITADDVEKESSKLP